MSTHVERQADLLSLHSGSEVEVQIATHEGKRLRALIKTQLTMVERLTAEAKILEAIYNLVRSALTEI